LVRPYSPKEVDLGEKDFLQRMALETVQEYEQPAQALRTS
jgi:hypothetical protein